MKMKGEVRRMLMRAISLMMIKKCKNKRHKGTKMRMMKRQSSSLRVKPMPVRIQKKMFIIN
jgi:hypothetical protein